MAVQFKANPQQANVARHFNGKSVTAVTIDAGAGDLLAAVNGIVLGPNGAFQAIITSISDYATPILISPIRADKVFDVYFEGEFGTDNYGTRATEPRTFAAYLVERIKALGTVGGIDLKDATVEAMGVANFQADQINATGVPYENAK
jgi:hypothetical protein